MRRSENLSLTPSTLEEVEPDEEEDLKRDRNRSRDGRPFIEKDNGNRSGQAKVFKGSKEDIAHPS